MGGARDVSLVLRWSLVVPRAVALLGPSCGSPPEVPVFFRAVARKYTL